MNKKLVALLMGFAVLVLATGFSGCEKEDPLVVGDLVWCQSYTGEGNMWEPAKVTAIEGEEVTIKWEDPFMKESEEQAKHKSEVVKKAVPDPKKIKVGQEIIVHPPQFLYPYKGEIVEIIDNDYVVSYKSGSADLVDTVDLGALWKYTR